MQIGFIVSLVFAIIVALFAVMNSEPVFIRLFWGKYEFSQAIVILGSAALGAVTVVLLGVFGSIRKKLKIHELNNHIKVLEQENADLKKQLDLAHPDKIMHMSSESSEPTKLYANDERNVD